MTKEDADNKQPAEPRGFGEHTRGLTGEYAHEQGWALNVEERTKLPDVPQDIDGGKDYEYGARDFGDTPVNTEIPVDQRDPTQNSPSPTTREREQENR
jgi:hypothetical protein